MGGSYEQHFGPRKRAFEPPVALALEPPFGPPVHTRGDPAGKPSYGARPDPMPWHPGPDAVEAYLVERLRAAGWRGSPVLDLGLAPLLFEATNGERAAIDRAMTALLDDAARAGADTISGDHLAAWLDRQPPPAGDQATHSAADARLGAIEDAFADQGRKLSQLCAQLAGLRETAAAAAPRPPSDWADRLAVIESRLDQQDIALRHLLERLIAFFEHADP